MLHKEIPFLRIGLPICAGIISGLYFKPDYLFLVVITFIVFSGFIISLLFNSKESNLIYGVALTISLFTCGILLYSNEKSSISKLQPEQSIFSGTLSDYPVEKENSIMLTLKLKSKISQTGKESVKGSMTIYNKKDIKINQFLPGDLITLKCTPVEITNRGNPYEFDYKFYMENQNIRYYAFTSGIDILSHKIPSHRKISHLALITREKIIGMYKERGIKGDELALVAAMTLGQKNMLDQEQKQYFIKAGVMHIMAVSGLHTVILSLFIFNILFFLKGRYNIVRIIIALAFLWAFAFVTGLTPSVLRATLMFSFLQAGSLMKREVNSVNSVLASAFVLILLKPSVIFDAGFLLSYSAVIYIISFYKDLYSKLHFKNWLTDKIWQSAVITIIAQAGTLPLTITLFNRFPTYFLLTNIIIVPLSSLLIILGCIMPVFFPVHFFSLIIAFILNHLTWLTEYITFRASSLPWSTIENIGMTSLECALLTGTIFLFTCYIIKKESFSAFYPLTVFFLFVISGSVKEIRTRTTNELIVYNTPGSTTVGIKTGKILNLYSDTLTVKAEVIKHSSTLGLKIKQNNLTNESYCIQAGLKRIAICKSPDNTVFKKFKPDIVVLTGSKPHPEKCSFPEKYPEALIISSKSSVRYQIPPQRDFKEIDTIHLVRKSGAFIRRI